VTVAATDDIVIVDDLTYSVDPGAGTCRDILGIFGGDDVIVADNVINAPWLPGGGNPDPYLTFDDTKDEFIHGVVLALRNFSVENFASGATTAEACEATNWGRGCLYLTGGVIQDTRGPVSYSQAVGGSGYLKRYAYDQCAAVDPPPYFPTTGHFARGRFFEVDPVSFDVGPASVPGVATLPLSPLPCSALQMDLRHTAPYWGWTPSIRGSMAARSSRDPSSGVSLRGT
jgi:hypothetical protein